MLVSIVQAIIPSLDYTSALAVVVLAIVLLAMVAFKALQQGGVVSPSSGNTVLIVGPMGSGKTALFYRLVLGEGSKLPKTVTSQAPNAEEFSPCEEKSSKKLQLVDLPGHDSQWPAAMERTSDAAGIIFLMDSSKPQTTVAGQKLFDLLCDPGLKKRKIPFLVACNKSEEEGAKSLDDIQDDLHADLQDRTEFKDTIEDTEGNTIVKKMTEDDESDFKFEELPCPIKFTTVSLKKGDIAPIEKFCQELLR
uniref:Signal recognition particle receptor subunit beta n=1 Tax=Lotharella globosa TaxID=91324 RepID=A0A6V3REA5_9EUKA|mmetsp:Transcript_479/g.857  ORF Transcript_479/g.857 Transcript_479/m.857 type:complete len:250 (+) Transcript_479:89-838(+)